MEQWFGFGDCKVPSWWERSYRRDKGNLDDSDYTDAELLAYYDILEENEKRVAEVPPTEVKTAKGEK